jgi:deoxycytidylate deaminase
VSRSIDRGFDTALAAAELSDAPHVARKMGAALFAGARLLSVGCNLYGRSHPASDNDQHFAVSTHAEHKALLKRQYSPSSNLVLYVARRWANGRAACSKPCANCIRLAKIAGVKRVRYFDEQGLQKEIAL